MSARMQVPLSQRRHTNVAAVRYTKNGHKLEIACYKNKVISYRNGVETRLDEVLQIDRVFTNISRGLFASEKDIQAVFGKGTTEEDALKYILVHGELQVAQHEREVEVNQMFTDIALIISQKCVNEVTQRPFPAQVIEQALRSIGAAVRLDQPAKKQALALIHRLMDAQIIPIARAPMKLRCTTVDEQSLKKVTEWCESNRATILEEPGETCQDETVHGAGKYSLLILLQPHLFRDLEIFVKDELPHGATVHMIDSVAMDVGEVDVMDADLIARANAHTNAADKSVGGGGGSHQTGSSSNPTQCLNNNNKGGKKGEKSGRKQKNAKYSLQKNDDTPQEEQGTPLTADLSSTGPGVVDDKEISDVKTALSKLGLDNPCALDDHDDDDKNKRGKKKAKRRQGAQQQSQQPASSKKEVEVEAQEDSDEEVLVNRKQRKMAAVKAKDISNNHDCDFDDEYNYEYDMEEGVGEE